MPVYKLRSTPPASGAAPEYSVVINECHRESSQILCSGKMTNNTDASIDIMEANSTNAVDDEGNQIRSNLAFGMGHNFATLIPNDPTNFSVAVADEHQNAKTINFQLFIYWRSYVQYDDLTFQGIQIQ